MSRMTVRSNLPLQLVVTPFMSRRPHEAWRTKSAGSFKRANADSASAVIGVTSALGVGGAKVSLPVVSARSQKSVSSSARMVSRSCFDSGSVGGLSPDLLSNIDDSCDNVCSFLVTDDPELSISTAVKVSSVSGIGVPAVRPMNGDHVEFQDGHSPLRSGKFSDHPPEGVNVSAPPSGVLVSLVGRPATAGDPRGGRCL